ncbi:MAG TPA: phosphatase domain-containing protein [Gammaproteobacteria bacterium]
MPTLRKICAGLLFVSTLSCYAEPPPPPRAVTTNLKSDETVILFPTNVFFDAKQNRWVAHIHGWVFEPEQDSALRNSLIGSVRAFLDIDQSSHAYPLFTARTRMFLVDNEGDKDIALQVRGQNIQAHKTGDNGHFELLTPLAIETSGCTKWLNVKVITPQDDQRDFSGRIQCVAEQGISVISDIDDTIKQSNVLDKKELMKNTFVRDFKAVHGMAELYRAWSAQGYAFHYVSSSPWQLYPALNAFLLDADYPAGSMHLKLVRLKDTSFFNLFDTPEAGKFPEITALLTQYPQRKFILVGDAGEKDPEIYARIAKDNPDRILKILIRRLPGQSGDLTPRFAGLAASKWQVFEQAEQVLNAIAIRDPR